MSTLRVTEIQSNSTAFNTPVLFETSGGVENGTLCRTWVNFNGQGTVAIRADFNVNTVGDNGTGDYTVNFTNALSDSNYSVVGSAERDGNPSDNALLCHRTRTTTSVKINTARANTDLFDYLAPCIAIFR